MKNLILSGLMVLAVTLNLWAVDGIAVTVRNPAQTWSGDNFKGDIYRIDIKNSDTVKSTKLVSAPASHPHISPNGKRVAFFQTDNSGAWFVCVTSIDGGTITKLCPAHPYSTLDFPANDWIYWANGSGGDVSVRMNPGDKDSCEYIYRVNANGGAREFVVRLLGSPYGGAPTAVSTGGEDLVVDTGLTRLCFHPYYGGASGGYTIYFLSWGDGVWRKGYTRDGCGGGMSFDGHYLLLGQQSHADYDIININFPGGITDTNYACCVQAVPGSIVKKDVHCGEQHWYYSCGGATNNADWICRCLPSVAAYNYQNGQCLFNWVTLEHVHTGEGDGGDFWVGTASQSTTMVLNPATVSFAAEKGGASPAAQTVQIANSGSGALNTVTIDSIHYANGAGWLTVGVGGTGNAQTLTNTVTLGSLAIGTYSATVNVSCANSQPKTALYSVVLQVTDPTLTLANVTVTPAKCTTSTWTTIPFTAVATANTGAVVPPAFKWSVSGGQFIDSASGLFSAGSAPGGPYTVTASATYKGVTKSSTATVLLYRPVTITAPLQGATYKIGDT
ncbi:MAG: hypothetical protein PHC61_18565, partial [Chitinivibrionales bacterium]|nr:hypothetical protein [Chitinivibrionales bacterium]